jgi:glyoxylase-like metal-dependent hydrolase (beta-lactamase superfamily II)
MLIPLVGAALRAVLLVIALSLTAGCAQAPADRTSGVQRMYVFNCGEAQIPDVSPWSPGVNVGKAAQFSDNCYLIVHGNDLMLWDSGYSDTIAATPGGVAGPRSTAMLKKTLAAQMAELGIKPEQVTRIAFSHTHSDHVGNANMFTSATLYIQQAEYDAAFGTEPAKFGFVATNYDKLRASPMIKLNGDYDVFGDGSVLILSTPGHTPGHQSLLVRLPKTGVVVLSGDAAHFKENFDNRRVPAFNFNKEQSVHSMDKLARVVAAEHGQLWINHDIAQSATIPHAPQFVD